MIAFPSIEDKETEHSSGKLQADSRLFSFAIIILLMNRYILFGGAVVFALISAVVLWSLVDQPTPTDYQMARGRSQFFTENYLAALQTLRDLPNSEKYGSDRHSYLGAAYLKLHLYQAAITEFEQAIKTQPGRSDPWIGLASSYIQLGDAGKAVDQARRATEIEKSSVEAWLALGRAYWQQRNFEQAEQAALKARDLDATHPSITELLLRIYFDQNNAGKFQAELDRTSKPAKPIQDLAIRFFVRQGQFSRAYDWKIRYERQALDRAVLETELNLKRDPSRTDLIPLLVKNLVKTGRYEDAVAAAKGYPGPVALDLELGKAYWLTGRRDEAIDAYRRASSGLVHKLSAEVALAAITGDLQHWQNAYSAERVEQDYFVLARVEDVLAKAAPNVRALAYRYAGIYEPSFYNNAAQEALTVLNNDPKNFEALMTIATAYHRLGRIEDATRYLELARDFYPAKGEPASRLASVNLLLPKPDSDKILQLMETAATLDPRNAGYLYNLGWAYDQLGDTGKATGLYERAIKASPLTFEAMNNLALIYSAAGQHDRALPLLEQAMRTDPENEGVYVNAANYYARRRDWKEALEHYERALQINPASSIAAVERGRIYLEQGRSEEAVDNLSRALEVDSHSFDAYLLLASAYEKMGHIKEAIAAAEEARRIRADAPEVKTTLDRLNERQKETK
jgi:tetratricopeptide (TPR) repeat protein